jgi:threonine/homoserine/homoserine lactone efflux protein
MGLLVHVTAATVGLSALVASSATAFTVVKIVGAAYLVLLGLQSLWFSRKKSRGHYGRGVLGPASVASRASLSSALRQGLLTNVLNPKVAVFFVAFLPQFVPAGAPTLQSTAVLGAAFVLMTSAYLLLLVAATVRAATLLARPAVRRGLDRAAGVVFIGFGIRLATANR